MNYLNTKANKRKLAANRYRNARYLLFERCSGEIARFARTLQKSHSYVSAYLSESPTKRMGEKVARQIEEAFGLSSCWLDDDRSQGWDRRLREAIGGKVHPLDGVESEPEYSKDHARWLASLATLPESGPDLLRVGRESQRHLEQLQKEILRLTEYRRELLDISYKLYEPALETYLLANGYVVKPPSYEQGQVFQVWHPEPKIKSCLQLRIQQTFEPVLELIPVPPVTREVIVLPFISEQSNAVEFLFFAADERSSPLDVTRLVKDEGRLWLLGANGGRQRDLTAKLSLEPLFE